MLGNFFKCRITPIALNKLINIYFALYCYEKFSQFAMNTFLFKSNTLVCYYT